MDWFLYDNGVRHERVKHTITDSTELIHQEFISFQTPSQMHPSPAALC